MIGETVSHYRIVEKLGRVLYAGGGDSDQALACLEKAYDQRDSGIVFMKVDPLFDPLRSDPRFQVLLRKIGLPE